MVVEERPGMETCKLTFTRNSRPGQEILPIIIYPKNGTSLDPPAHNMMQSLGASSFSCLGMSTNVHFPSPMSRNISLCTICVHFMIV
jgi:hypothetical protein